MFDRFHRLYSNHLAVHIDALNKRILEEYKKNDKLEEITRAHVTHPLAELPAAYLAFPTIPGNFVEQTRRLLNERAAAAVSTNDTPIQEIRQF